MIATSHLLAFAVAATVLVLLPGPSVLFVIGRSLALGRRGGLLTVLGITLGLLPAIVLVAVGVGALVAESAVVFTALKLAGAAYLVYLGVQTVRHRRVSDVVVETETPTAFRLVRAGFLVGLTNPKVLVFFAAVLPQFVDPDGGAVPAQLLVLGAVFMLIGMLCDGTWALVAGTAREWFGGSPRRLSGMRAGGGVMMVGLGGALAVTGRHT